MNRQALALALFFCAAGASRADYIIIIQSKPAPGASGAAGAMGAVGQFGNLGMGGFPPAAGAVGAAGAGGFPPAAGAVGAAGNRGVMGAGGFGPPGAAGAVGAAGNRGVMGFPPAAGVMGAGGFGPPGAAGAAGGPPGVLGGLPGAMGLMGGQPQDGFGGAEGFKGFQGGSPDKGPPPIRVMAVIETKNQIKKQAINKDSKTLVPCYYALHNWGESWLAGLQVDVVLLQNGGRRVPSVAFRFEDSKKRLTEKGRKLEAQDYLNLAEWALTHGLIGEFEKTMQDFAAFDGKHPSADAFVKVKAALEAGIASSKEATRWKENQLFRNFKLATNNFYALLHKSREDSQEVLSRLRHLRENFVAFYYWHALKGKVLPMPHDKLVCVLVPFGESGTEFNKDHGLFDSVAITADSFYSPRHNLVVFSAQRRDIPYRGLVKDTDELWSRFGRDDILKKGAKIPAKEQGKLTGAHLILAQTYSVLLHALDEDAERASVSHSGTRQILVGSGILPRSVELPQWIQSGAGSFMQTPYGSPWRMYGAPHWSYLLSFRELKKEKLPPASELMRSVISDRFFNDSPKKDPSVKARSTAWALTYFLAQKRLDGLHAYYRELSRLPRDLDISSDVLMDCFARALGCVDASNKRDDQKLSDLADAWMNFMEQEVKLDPEASDILAEIHKMQNELAEELKAAK